MNKLRLQDLQLKNKRVLVRVDFNVPQDKNLNITDDSRIRASLPTIQYILDQGGSVILMSHFGRPGGKRIPEFSLAPCAQRLSELLHQPVLMASDCIGKEVEAIAQSLRPGEVLLLENLRFHPAEEKPELDPSFVKKLANLGDVYVNDAFGTAHRAHSSTTFLAKEFPGFAAAGFLMQKEIEFLGAVFLHPKKPFHAIIGGAKVSSKLGVVKALLNKVDAIYIGGGMAFTFLKAQGIEIGKSLCEDDLLSQAKEILEECRCQECACHLPIDVLAAEECKPGAKVTLVRIAEGIPKTMLGLDIGPETVKAWGKELKDAKTIFWNGPVGVAEIPEFAEGTKAIASLLASSQAITVVGGGDSIAALQALGFADQIDHISTGGGASLEFIEIGTLPGLEALSDTE